MERYPFPRTVCDTRRDRRSSIVRCYRRRARYTLCEHLVSRDEQARRRSMDRYIPILSYTPFVLSSMTMERTGTAWLTFHSGRVDHTTCQVPRNLSSGNCPTESCAVSESGANIWTGESDMADAGCKVFERVPSVKAMSYTCRRDLKG